MYAYTYLPTYPHEIFCFLFFVFARFVFNTRPSENTSLQSVYNKKKKSGSQYPMVQTPPTYVVQHCMCMYVLMACRTCPRKNSESSLRHTATHTTPTRKTLLLLRRHPQPPPPHIHTHTHTKTLLLLRRHPQPPPPLPPILLLLTGKRLCLTSTGRRGARVAECTPLSARPAAPLATSQTRTVMLPRASRGG